MYAVQTLSRVRPNILTQIKCRLSIIGETSSYSRTLAKHEFINGEHVFTWYEYELNKLTHKLIFTQKKLALETDVLLKAISSRDNPYDCNDVIGSMYHTKDGVTYYISISEGIHFGALFVFVNVSGVENETGQGFDISRRKFYKIIKRYSG